MDITRKKQLDDVMLRCAEEFSTMSLATRSKVGAIIANNGNIESCGWNGMPSGMPNDELEYVDSAGNLVTNSLALHAESNAIIKAGPKSDGATLYCTYSPCPECSKLIIQAKIKRIVFRNYYRIVAALPALEKAGIELVHKPKGDVP
jgi:dCMP deaminase